MGIQISLEHVFFIFFPWISEMKTRSCTTKHILFNQMCRFGLRERSFPYVFTRQTPTVVVFRYELYYEIKRHKARAFP